MKRFRALIPAFILAMLFSLCGAQASQLRGYDKAAGGYQYLYLGQYPYEEDGTPAPILWEILRVQDGRALILTTEVLDTHQVIEVTDESDIKNYRYRKIETYAQSDLYTWMNGEMRETLLGGEPLAGALVETENGFLYPLADEELLNPALGFTTGVYKLNKPRIALATPYCKKQRDIYVDSATGGSTYWGSAIKATAGYKLRIVGYDGHLSWGVYSRKNIGIRAAATLDLSKCEPLSGAGTKEDPFLFGLIGAEPTVESTPEPTAEPTPEPTAEPTPESTLEPTAEPAPESVLEPTDEQPMAESSPEPTAEPLPEAASDPNLLKLSFVGDCSIGDATQSRDRETSLTSTIEKNGYAWPFSLVSQYLLADDLTFANLEVNLTTQVRLKSDKVYNMIGKPDFVNVLLQGGIDVCNTVNNHCMDFTDAGHRDTQAVLDEAGILHFGTVYPGQSRGSDILGVKTVKGVKIGMIGFSYPSDSDLERIASRIAILREDGCSLIVVSLHWGRETHMTSENWQFAYAKKVIDYGADVIWGHHPHVVQPIYLYKGKPVFFSTGNFVFGTISDMDKSTGVFQLDYALEEGKPVLKTLRVVPCQTTGRGDYRPYELTEQKDRERCLKKLYGKKKITGYTCLPESFVTTGSVSFLPDGSVVQE